MFPIRSLTPLQAKVLALTAGFTCSSSGGIGGHLTQPLSQIFPEGSIYCFKDNFRHTTEDPVRMVENPIIPDGIEFVFGQSFGGHGRSPSTQFTDNPAIADPCYQLTAVHKRIHF
jgi:hypothetical protein